MRSADPPEAERGTAEQLDARLGTTYLLDQGIAGLVKASIRTALRRPGRYLRALRLAWRTRRPGVKGAIKQLAYLAEAAVLCGHLRDAGMTHVHNHFADSSCTVAMLAAELAGGSFSFTLHGPAEFYDAERWQLGEKARRAAFVSCISHFARSQLMLFAKPDCWPRLHVVHCGVQVDRVAGVSTGSTEPAPPTGAELLFVGRLARAKGVLVLLEALGELVFRGHRVRLTLIGDGPDRDVIERRVAGLELRSRVTLLGYRGQAEIRHRLASACMLVLPSFAEGVPVVLMEALAAGRPVVTTQIAGVPELVRHGQSGLLVPPGDSAALADAIETLLSDPALGARMGEAGRRHVHDEFNITREATWLHELFTHYTGPAALRTGGDRRDAPAIRPARRAGPGAPADTEPDSTPMNLSPAEHGTDNLIERHAND